MILLELYSFVEKARIVRRYESITMNYIFDDRRSTISLSQHALNLTFLVVRCFVSAQKIFYSLCHSVFLREKLELQVFDREYFRKDVDCATDNRCLSLSLTLFIDEFDLYRNAYRSLMKFYLQLANLSFHDRMRRSNVFSLTLESHDSNFDDVVNALQNLRHFDREVVLELSQLTRIIAFSICFLDDMSQQQANADFKTQRANRDCRFCFISANTREDLDFDIIRQDRFHTYAMQQRDEMNSIRTKANKEKYASE